MYIKSTANIILKVKNIVCVKNVLGNIFYNFFVFQNRMHVTFLGMLSVVGKSRRVFNTSTLVHCTE